MLVYMRAHWKRIASLAAFVIFFYLLLCGLHYMQMDSQMKLRRCFISKIYTWR